MRETLAGIRVIRAFVRTEHEERRFDSANQDLYETGLKVNRLFALTIPTLTAIINLSTVAVMWFGAIRVDSGAMPIGNLTAFLQYLMLILFSVLSAVIMFVFVPRAAVSSVRIQEVLETELSIRDPERPIRLVDAGQRGVVEFRDVEFRYPGAEEPVLRGVSFTALPGQTTAIVGSTGSGKSTLINLIPRFYDATEGQVLVDGVDVRERRPRRPLAAHRLRAPAGLPVQRHRRQQPALRRRGTPPTTSSGRRSRSPRRATSSRRWTAARGADHPGRHERLGRPAPAPGHRPGARARAASTSSTTASRPSTSAPTRGCGRRSRGSSATRP